MRDHNVNVDPVYVMRIHVTYIYLYI